MGFRLLILGCGVLGLLQGSALQAQVFGVTSVSTQDFTASTLTRSGITEFTGSNNYTLTYNGTERRIQTFVANSLVWQPFRTDGTVRVRRNNASGANQSFPLINPPQTAAFNATQTVGGTAPNLTQTIWGRYYNTMEALFTSSNVFTGTENLFVNTDAGNPGNPNVVTNIERMDYLFSGGVTASSGLSFAIFERGLGTGGGGTNGTFRVAAITAVNGSGDPTNFSNTLLVTPTQYNNGGVGVGSLGTPSSSLTGATSAIFRYSVTRFDNPSGPDLDLMNNANIGPQGIAGAMIPTTAFVPAGTTIFGYAVMGADVTGNGTQLVDVNGVDGGGNRFFPLLSPFSNDMDMVATGAVIYSVVPEPATVALALAGLSAGGFAFWRRRQAKVLAAAEAEAESDNTATT